MFAHEAWEAELEALKDEVAARGGDLMAWLGETAEAHMATFVVLEGSDGGMSIAKVAPGETPPPDSLVFQAYTANCKEGLACFPPAFAPGPPWGATFWAERRDPWEARYDKAWCEVDGGGDTGGTVDVDGTTIADSATDSGGSGGSGDDRVPRDTSEKGESVSEPGPGSGVQDMGMWCGRPNEMRHVRIVEADEDEGENTDGDEGERRVHPNDPKGEAYTLREFVRFARECGMPSWFGDFLFNQAGGDDVRFNWDTRCDCARRPREAAKKGRHIGDFEEVGAWLRLSGRGVTEQWAFCAMSDPLHDENCPVWRHATTFLVRISSGA